MENGLVSDTQSATDSVADSSTKPGISVPITENADAFYVVKKGEQDVPFPLLETLGGDDFVLIDWTAGILAIDGGAGSDLVTVVNDSPDYTVTKIDDHYHLSGGGFDLKLKNVELLSLNGKAYDLPTEKYDAAGRLVDLDNPIFQIAYAVQEGTDEKDRFTLSAEDGNESGILETDKDTGNIFRKAYYFDLVGGNDVVEVEKAGPAGREDLLVNAFMGAGDDQIILPGSYDDYSVRKHHSYYLKDNVYFIHNISGENIRVSASGLETLSFATGGKLVSFSLQDMVADETGKLDFRNAPRKLEISATSEPESVDLLPAVHATAFNDAVL